MTFYLDPKGGRHNVGRPFSYNEINYTSAGATAETFLELGFKEVTPDPRPDDRYYIVNSYPDENGHWDVQPRDVDELKAAEVASVKQTCSSLLSPTDWQVIRQTETGEPMSPEVVEYRKNVRAANNANEDAVNKCSSIEDLQALVIVWPEVPE